MSPKDKGPITGKGDILNLKTEVLFLHGKHDLYCDKDTLGEYKKYLGDKMYVKVFEDCGHAIHHFHPETVCKLIAGFSNLEENKSFIQKGE